MGIPKAGAESKVSTAISASAFLSGVFRVVISVVFILKIVMKSDREAGQAYARPAICSLDCDCGVHIRSRHHCPLWVGGGSLGFAPSVVVFALLCTS